MLRDRWYETPRRLPLLFVAVTVIPVFALGWLTTELIDRDRRLATQRLLERAERAADAIVAASHQRLSELESHLDRLDAGVPDHAVLAIAEADRVTVAPAGALLYYPIVAATEQPPRDAFAEGERYEHRLGDSSRAIAWFRSRSRSDDPAVRAGALLRLARNQRKAGQINAALATYEDLARLGATPVDGFPAGLLALAARCTLLEQAERRAELAISARVLRTALRNGAWPLQRDAYEFYVEQARRWTGEAEEAEGDRDAEAIAAAFQMTYEQWVTDGSAPRKQWLVMQGRPVLMASVATPKRLIVLMAAAHFLEDAWKDVKGARIALTDAQGHPMLGMLAADSAPRAVRTTETTGLPWTLRVAATNLEVDSHEAAERRRLQLAGAAMMLLLIGGAAYFVLRAVARELAVARLQADFVAAVSHEFRTPLASVRHLSDMLSKGRISNEAQRQQSYDFLSRESERLEHLVEGLLDFGRIEAGAYHYRFERIDVGRLVCEVVAEFQQQATQKGYRIERSGEIDNVLVLADREALSRVIWNLLDNAVKYSPGSDTIWVELALDGDVAAIRIRDRGLGIPVDEQKVIFRKFVRGNNAREGRIKGTGIGLAMVRYIVEAHHGEVRVESQPNEGSTFTIFLPVGRAA